jgi:hypothetical protein
MAGALRCDRQNRTCTFGSEVDDRCEGSVLSPPHITALALGRVMALGFSNRHPMELGIQPSLYTLKN